MVKTCCVKNCDIASERNITCFRFPNSRLIKRQWIDAIGLSNKLTANSLICIRHFQEDDYDIVRGRPRLKAKVVPSVFSELRNRSHTPDTKGNKSPLSRIHEDTNNSTELSSEKLSETCNILQNEEKEDSNNLQREHNNVTEDCKNLLNDGNEVPRGCKSLKNKDNELPEDCASLKNENCDVPEDCNNFQNKDADKTDKKVEDTISKDSNRNVKQDSKKNKPNGVLSTSKRKNSQELLIESTPKIQLSNSADDLNKDIEDIIVNYQIKQTRPVHSLEVIEKSPEEEWQRIEENGVEDGKASSEEVEKSDPVFIEVAVQGKGDRAGSPRDCLMVLESVQVELDPQSFLNEDGEHPDADCHETVDLDDDVDDGPDENGRTQPNRTASRRPEEISLLTSSDEDEVILQEPHIDTVEVSDETDEDDMPLVRLLKRSLGRAGRRPGEYLCVDCHYTTRNRAHYQMHVARHSTILQVCEICDYTTASKTMFSRHKRKHKDDKKFKCHLCEYKARHNMSLIYHLKNHRALSNSKRGFKCDKCGFESDVKKVVLKHVKLCTTNVKRHPCDKCAYETDRASDLKRHKIRRHNDDNDAEFVL